MGEGKRLVLLIVVLVVVTLSVAGIAVSLLYRAAIIEERGRLMETAQSQARLIEAIARHEQSEHGAEGTDMSQTTDMALALVADAHSHYDGFGETGEFTLARQEEGMIVFLLSHRHYDLQFPKPVPVDSDWAEPMRMALSGRSGTTIGLDYRGVYVLAAYEPVGELDMGIVAKIDLTEVRAPFIQATLIALGSAVGAIALGALLFSVITNPLIRRLASSEQALQTYSEELETRVEERTKELHDAQDRLVRREKLAILGQLAGGVGHELRNPLGVISNACYYLQTTLTDADEKTTEYLGIIDSEVSRSTKIISDLLDFSRTKASERQEVTIAELVASVLNRQPPPSQVEITNAVRDDLSAVYVDEAQIVQVLGNIISNAYQAMPEGGKLTIESKEREGRVDLSFTDTGCGISKENMSRLFEPLFTTKERGIGLGLATSKSLLDVNGGHIEVTSEEGQGTTFIVTLPSKEVRT